MKKIICALLSALVFSGSVCAASVPAEEYDHLTYTEITPWLKNFHLTTVEQINNGVRGGEGYQINYSAAISDVDADYMIKGYDTSGTYYSHDGGVTWIPSESGIAECVLSLAFYPGSRDIAFALCTGTDSDTGVGGIYKTEDSGKTWRRTHKIAHGYTIAMSDIVFSAPDKTTGNYAIYFTVNKSTSSNVAYGNPRYAGVFKSVDLGESFTNVGLSDYLMSNLYADRESDLVIATIQSKAGDDGKTAAPVPGGLYVSRDAGVTWTQKCNGIEDFPIRSVTVNPKDRNTWICSPDVCDENDAPMLYQSTDGGESWHKIEDLKWYSETDLNPHPVNGDGGARITHLMYTWPDENGDMALIAMMNQTNWPNRISFDGGHTFEVINADDTNYPQKGGIGWYAQRAAVSQDSPDLILWNINISHDKGHSFKWSSSGISGGLSVPFIFDEKGVIKYIGLFDVGLVKRVDGYEGYYPPMQLVEEFPATSRTTTGIAIDPNDPDHGFALTGASAYGQESTLVETFDGFETFRLQVGMAERLQQMTLEAGKRRNVRYVWYSQTDSDVVYTDWFVSEDNGKTWRESEHLIKAISPFDGDVAYTVEDGVLWITRNRAKTWQNTGITLGAVEYAMTADIYEDYVIWCGRHSTAETSLYRVDLKDGSVKVYGAANGIAVPSGNGLQMGKFAQSPLDKNICVTSGRDYYGDGTYTFISNDAGETWEIIEGLPKAANCSNPTFHPTKPWVYLGGPQGTFILDYEKYFNREGADE